MIVRTFEFGYDDTYGWGFAPEGCENADHGFGLFAAHDTLEHFPGGDFGCHDELMAFGCIYWLRWLNQALPNQYNGFTGKTAKEYFESDIIEIVNHHLHEGLDLPEPPPFRWGSGWDNEHMREQLEGAGVIAAKGYKEGWDCDYHADVEQDPDYERRFNEAFTKVDGWLVRGVRKAQKRYADLDSYTLAYEVFKPIQAAVDEFDKLDEDTGQGVFMRITVSPKKYEWGVTLYRNEFYTEDGSYRRLYDRDKPWTNPNCVVAHRGSIGKVEARGYLDGI